MKIFNIKNIFKKKILKNGKNDEFIFIPLYVLNDSNMNTNDFENNSSRILRTKQFQRTKKIKHPSGTTIIRANDYEFLKNKKIEDKTLDKKKFTKLISYKAPSKSLKKKDFETKGSWKY